MSSSRIRTTSFDEPSVRDSGAKANIHEMNLILSLEREKLALEKRRFQRESDVKKLRFENDIKKLNLQLSLEREKMALEERRFKRESDSEKRRLENDIEKLNLQLSLEL